MTYFIFALVALFAWSGSDLFSKLGTSQKDKNSHWHVIFAVGVIMGIHAVITIIFGSFIDPDTIPSWLASVIYTDFKPMDFVKYLPIAFIYLAAMVIGYVGLRYIELSVSSPICNSSGSLALVICLFFGWATIDGWTIAGVILVTVGIIMLGIVEYRESDEIKLARQNKSNFKYTKSLWAILIPVIYLIMDALGTVGDQLVSELELFDMSEYASNTAFEFTSLCFAIFAFIYVKVIKKQKFFYLDNEDAPRDKVLKRNLLFGGLCETVGQIFYMAVMFSDFDAGMPMISAYCVLSVVWSRIFLKEKLSYKHYIAIALTFAGIILLGIFSPV
ncbi:MAG: EamA family transporter [Candidatus Borkfalkiaceae bacterium]|nr:EamA family transporter [Christensenellaceae bacterium]